MRILSSTLAAFALACLLAVPALAQGADRDCPDFPSQAAAQKYFVDRGGSPDNNVDRLDRDRDGVACENQTGYRDPARNVTPGGRTTPTPQPTTPPEPDPTEEPTEERETGTPTAAPDTTEGETSPVATPDVPAGVGENGGGGLAPGGAPLGGALAMLSLALAGAWGLVRRR